jgi:hypothetical protein
MNQEEKDLERYYQMVQKRQYQDWINATENGDPYYIDEHGDVIIQKVKKNEL